MRIQDIVTELGIVNAVDTVRKTYAKNYNRGYDAVDRIINPNRWQQQANEPQTVQDLDTDQLRFALDSVIKGQRLYQRDQQILLAASAAVKQQQIATKLDHRHLALVLKAAGQGQQMNSSQISFLSKFRQEL